IDANADGVQDLALPGANPLRKNLYLELDFMAGHRPNRRAVAAVIDAFARSPLGNPDGTTGIDLEVTIDDTQVIPHSTVVDFTCGSFLGFDNCEGEQFKLLKGQYFGSFGDSEPTRIARGWVYRYGIFAHDPPSD